MSTCSGARGVGIFCGDSSDCEIERNVVSGMRGDGSGDRSRAGVGIEAHYNALAHLEGNVLDGNRLAVAEIAGGEIRRR